MTLRKFFVLSCIVHASIILMVYLLPPKQEEKQKELFPRIVTPEESQQPEPETFPPPEKPGPLRKPVPKPEPKQLVRPAPPDRPETGPPEKPLRSSVPGQDGAADRGQAPEFKGESIPFGERPFVSDDESLPFPKGRDSLFDRDVIGEIARRDPATSEQQESSVTFDTSEYRYRPYMQRLKEKIESIWTYPPEAARRGIYGDLRIRFTILKNGRLGKIELIRTSGYRFLDDAAIKALRDGEPYWPLPEEWGKDSHTISGHFIYTFQGYYVR